jgi:hypothetical protein
MFFIFIAIFLVIFAIGIICIFPNIKKMQKSFDLLGLNIMEISSGLRTILAFDAFLFHQKKIIKTGRDLKNSNTVLSIMNLLIPMVNFFSFLLSVSVYMLGGYL